MRHGPAAAHAAPVEAGLASGRRRRQRRWRRLLRHLSYSCLTPYSVVCTAVRTATMHTTQEVRHGKRWAMEVTLNLAAPFYRVRSVKPQRLRYQLSTRRGKTAGDAVRGGGPRPPHAAPPLSASAAESSRRRRAAQAVSAPRRARGRRPLRRARRPPRRTRLAPPPPHARPARVSCARPTARAALRAPAGQAFRVPPPSRPAAA
jgi:hypothetical protein